MKTSTNIIRNGFGAILTVLLGTLTLQSASAQIVADFTGGNSTNVVDAWRGKAGDGWLNSWQMAAQTGATLTATATDASPLTPGGGNYLQFTITNNHVSSDRIGWVSRQYENDQGIDLAQAHTITFEFRLDTPLTSINRFYLYDSNVSASTPQAAGTTWMIRGNSSGAIFVYNGTSAVTVTNMSLIPENVYRFTIDVNPSSTASESFYTVKIDNLTDGVSSYQSGNLLFYSASNAVGGYLNFNGWTPTNQVSTFSLDSIHIVPEPSPMALIGMTVLFMLITRRSFPKFRYKRQ